MAAKDADFGTLVHREPGRPFHQTWPAPHLPRCRLPLKPNAPLAACLPTLFSLLLITSPPHSIIDTQHRTTTTHRLVLSLVYLYSLSPQRLAFSLDLSVTSCAQRRHTTQDQVCHRIWPSIRHFSKGQIDPFPIPRIGLFACFFLVSFAKDLDRQPRYRRTERIR